MTDIDGVKGYALCQNNCDNMYPLSEKNKGIKKCPECRGIDRNVIRVETDPVLDSYEAKVFGE